MITAALLPLFAVDEVVFRFINSHHAGIFDAFFWGCSAFGSSFGIIPALTLFIFLKSKKGRVWIVLAAAAVMLIGGALLTSAVKQGVARPRPAVRFEAPEFGTAAAEVWKPFTVHVVGPRLGNYYSFPSGHTWTAFAVAAFMVLFFGRKYWWAYLVAVAIGYSRMYVGAHFPIDVLGGAVCGTLLALLVWRVTAWIVPQKARPPSRAET